MLGLALLSPGLALLIYGLAETSGAGGFGRSQVIGPGLVGLALLAGFVFHGLRTSDALIDLRLFANRVFAPPPVTLMLVIISVFGGMLLLPLYLQVGARRDGDGHRPAARPAGPRRDDRDADRRAA